jgi:hypothetical protein
MIIALYLLELVTVLSSIKLDTYQSHIAHLKNHSASSSLQRAFRLYPSQSEHFVSMIYRSEQKSYLQPSTFRSPSRRKQ